MPPVPEPLTPSALDLYDQQHSQQSATNQHIYDLEGQADQEPLLVPAVELQWYASISKSCDDVSTARTTPSSPSSSFWGNEESESNLGDEDEHDQANFEKRVSCGQHVWNSYYSCLEAYPLVVKSVTAFVLMGMADALAQTVEFARSEDNLLKWDELRMLRFAVFGLLGAPWTHVYYEWLDRTLPPTPDPWTATTAVKVIIDQFLQAPALLALIIMGLAFMEGRGIDGMRDDMEDQYLYSLMQNWKLWIPATIINIAFVKPTLRVLYDNVIFLVWTIYLSMILNDRETT